MTLASSGGHKMKDLWDYVKGFFIISIMVGAAYLGLAEGHEWWPYNQTTNTSKPDYTEELSDGYWAGYDAGFDDGYLWGHDDGFSLISTAEWQAEDYAISKSGWHPEEAMAVIDAYENNEIFIENGVIPSEEDYKNAIQCLYHFYDYFYCGMYEELYG